MIAHPDSWVPKAPPGTALPAGGPLRDVRERRAG
ncbi:hypothetical protein Wenmar_01077 [Wenxinia marina DSM 24838]|uniref:Uncharacterized protein n=1 Tax=Wenxinia marina DSM 24838 TaxID=1123501 RepID=A0A0D0Q8K7_9RHOB|nr:hypothetical protein Wenmar_01077 [Wenxinia marina DSM 24838]